MSVCDQAIHLAPRKPAVYRAKDDVLTKLKRYEEALVVYSQEDDFRQLVPLQ